MKDVVLLFERQLCERLVTPFTAAILVECRDALAIALCRGVLTFRPLLRFALLERGRDIEPGASAVRPSELTVDVDSATGVLAARRFWIGRNDAVDNRLDRARFVCGEEQPRSRPSRVGGVPWEWLPR